MVGRRGMALDGKGVGSTPGSGTAGSRQSFSVFKQRFADFHGLLVIRLFHAKRACMSAATLVGLHIRAGHHFEHFFRLFANVLHAAVTRDLVTHITKRLREFCFQQTITRFGMVPPRKQYYGLLENSICSTSTGK